MSDPRLIYVSRTPQAVSVSYSDLPDDTDIVFVNEFGGSSQAGPTLSGGGSADVATGGVKAGQYYLSARASGGELARTVNFYIAG